MSAASPIEDGSRRSVRAAGPGDLRTLRRALVAAFAGIAVVFTLGLAAAHAFVDRIRSSVAEVTDNSSPSISSLSELRSALRQLQVSLDRHLEACAEGACGAAPAPIAELLERVRGAWQRYRLLPTFPGEADRWPRVEADIDRLGAAVAGVLEPPGRRVDPGTAARLRRDLGPAFDRLDQDVAVVIEADHAAGRAVAERIETLTRWSTAASVVLDLVTLALTVAAAAIAVRLVRRSERALRDRAEDLELFAARVAHDVKSPLAITGAALHAARKLSPPAAQEPLERGQRGVRRVQRLVDDLLDFARAGVPEGRFAAELQPVVEEVVAELREVAAERDVQLRVEWPLTERVACSPGVLTSIVGNLVRNAIGHMGESPERVVQVRAARSEDARAVRIEVLDSGPGIPDDLAPRVFEPFVRGAGVDVPGSGLGLATVKRFVDAHGGRVGFCPRGDRPGTLFWLELPRGASPAPGAGARG